MYLDEQVLFVLIIRLRIEKDYIYKKIKLPGVGRELCLDSDLCDFVSF